VLFDLLHDLPHANAPCAVGYDVNDDNIIGDIDHLEHINCNSIDDQFDRYDEHGCNRYGVSD